jgi:1D-myo-inositol 3-kinase
MRELRTLVAGHVTHDRFGPRLRAGGAVYCARVHAALGARTRLWSAVGRDFACAAELTDLDWQAARGEHTTCFTNVYPEVGPRVQRLEGIAPAVEPPGTGGGDTWDVLHLAPVIGEIDLALWQRSVRARLVGINVQGWVRRPGAPIRAGAGSRSVAPQVWDPAPELLAGVGVACLSEEDLEGQPDLLARLVRAVPVVALTLGARGCEIYAARRRVRVGADEARCVDPTGAGDSFAAALLHGIARGAEPAEAARLASAVAALVVESEATSGVARIDEAPARARRIQLLD